jgi:hypothetical protein
MGAGRWVVLLGLLGAARQLPPHARATNRFVYSLRFCVLGRRMQLRFAAALR